MGESHSTERRRIARNTIDRKRFPSPCFGCDGRGNPLLSSLMTDIRATLRARLDAAVGSAQVLTRPRRRRSPISPTGAAATTARALAVVRPGSTAEVAAVVRACAEARRPHRSRKAATPACAAARRRTRAGDAVVLSLARMNRVRAVDPDNATLTAEAGVHAGRGAAGAPPTPACCSRCRWRPRAAARSAATSRPTPAAPPCFASATRASSCWASKSCSPTAASGTACAGLRKDNTGYDLKQLFIGAEGHARHRHRGGAEALSRAPHARHGARRARRRRPRRSRLLATR